LKNIIEIPIIKAALKAMEILKRKMKMDTLRDKE
jgi:hypothetical protein